MNSLNIISARVSPPASPTASRSSSFGNLLSGPGRESRRESKDAIFENEKGGLNDIADADSSIEEVVREDTPLLWKEVGPPANTLSTNILTRISTTLLNSIRWVLSTLAAPGVYFIACLYDERGKFTPYTQIRKVFTSGARRGSTSQALGIASLDGESPLVDFNGKPTGGRRGGSRAFNILYSNSSSSGMSSESESERDRSMSDGEPATGRQTRSKSQANSDKISPAKRSIRIKLHNEDNLRQRRSRKAKSANTQSDGSGGISSEVSAAMLKSPTSPASSSLGMVKYPRAPVPPRPLIPRRQPSYTLPEAPLHPQKTLILDLDETLIHSMSRGGPLGGHMIEVILKSLGPNTHPILYYVYKRPWCDEFLRRVCKWYNLVIFTASVQEYADPVIDWLEAERPFFSGRYYRQHCTFRAGSYIKDLTSVEPDLSKVMILDNSPASYIFHPDNAIPIEGWISDSSDYELLHLVPMLEGLQYVTDVRAFLALRGGEDGSHMSS